MQIKRKEEGVSPVIATILMVAITVVLAATLYMMLPSGSETDTTEAMSGRLANTGNNYWIVAIDSGSVSNTSDRAIMYNKSSGVSNNGWGKQDIDDVDNNDVTIIHNDNDGNDNINGGDTIRIVYEDTDGISMDSIEDNYQFRIQDTSLQVNLG